VGRHAPTLLVLEIEKRERLSFVDPEGTYTATLYRCSKWGI
jgi:hypothetical protein